ncbi:ERF family protein [Diaphorobacter caeni]|uniref:ERF family protein n=1 Tax=Diaphorobacter caeni TaxID=2784387 RepID=UPI00188F1384|nr:ERF family protein [Diaphorobacter caeni]MBF5007631.1 ERF family protein [Diaphorobacter caeni]
MITSESLAKIAPAVLAAQQTITFAAKDAVNGHLRNKYADLPAVIDAVKTALNDNGIAFMQTGSPSDDGKLHLTTRLLHTSGEWLQDTIVMPLPKQDPQGYGSAMTYARRYGLASITGLYQDDDDGTRAVAPANTKPVKRQLTAKIADELIKRLKGQQTTIHQIEDEYALSSDQRQQLLDGAMA